MRLKLTVLLYPFSKDALLEVVGYTPIHMLTARSHGQVGASLTDETEHL